MRRFFDEYGLFIIAVIFATSFLIIMQRVVLSGGSSVYTVFKTNTLYSIYDDTLTWGKVDEIGGIKNTTTTTVNSGQAAPRFKYTTTPAASEYVIVATSAETVTYTKAQLLNKFTLGGKLKAEGYGVSGLDMRVIVRTPVMKAADDASAVFAEQQYEPEYSAQIDYDKFGNRIYDGDDVSKTDRTVYDEVVYCSAPDPAKGEKNIFGGITFNQDLPHQIEVIFRVTDANNNKAEVTQWFTMTARTQKQILGFAD